jgi:predicted ATP-dependent endonuclease of OLD family
MKFPILRSFRLENFKAVQDSRTVRFTPLTVLIGNKLIVIEEIENGLDPRTVNLIIEEIRNAVESGRTQLILTTHSPYLLDLLSLSQIVFVERVDERPTFKRPADKASLQEWAKKFAPGRLYTMGLLGGRADR